MATAVLENLECPVCFEIPEKEVYQCENGHIYCANCEQQVSSCPQCKVRVDHLKKIRCRALEELLDNMKFACDFKDSGCRSKFARNEVSSHRKTCEFSPNRNSICYALGYSCGHIVSLKDLSKTLQHLKTDHDFIIRQTPHFDIKLEGFRQHNHRGSSMWTPIVIDKLHSDNHLFVILFLLDGSEDPMLSLVCLHLKNKPQEDENTFWAYFCISAANSKLNPSIKVSMESVNVNFAQKLINQAFLKVPLKSLQENYISNSYTALTVRFTLANNASTDVMEVEMPPETLKIFNRPRNNTETNNAQHTAQTVVRFTGISCHSCQRNPITNTRYKCLRCVDFDLCKKCFDAGNHQDDHIFVVMKTLEQYKMFREPWHRLLSNRDSLSPISEIPALGLLPGHDEQCADCVRRKQFICLTCKAITGFCSSCFEKSHHPTIHLFAYARRMPELKFIIAMLRHTGFSFEKVIQHFAFVYIKKNGI